MPCVARSNSGQIRQDPSPVHYTMEYSISLGSEACGVDGHGSKAEPQGRPPPRSNGMTGPIPTGNAVGEHRGCPTP